MDISDFLALPGARGIRVTIGPKVTDELWVDQTVFEMRKGELLEFCRSIPGVNDGPSWQLLKDRAGGKGTMAKFLIALGELVGAWTMHPPAAHPELWHSTLHPMVLAGSLTTAEGAGRIPKPSAGDLEPTARCACCGRPMGPSDSYHHDLVMSPYDERVCYECDEGGCDPNKRCNLGFVKRSQAEPCFPPKKGDEGVDDPEGYQEFLKKFE